MRQKLWLILGLFVLALSGCPLSETPVTNAVDNSVTRQDNMNVPEAAPLSTPPRVSRKYTGVAVGNRRLWTESVNTPEGFDRASRALILFYALKLDSQKTAENKTFNRPSVVKWLDKESNLALQNYRSAARTCGQNDWTCLAPANDFADFIGKARALQVPAALASWQEETAEFIRSYVAEQVRLAQLFPRTSSEIDLFNDNEWDGDKISDRKFFLTFDDGPSAAGGSTDKVLEMLAAQKKSAVFFVLGQNFANRRKSNAAALAALYKGQCIAAHGWEHVSHEKNSKFALGNRWQTSVTDTLELLKTSFAGTATPVLPLFRPPYGQRKPESGAFFQKEGVAVALWNLDSQDWNDQMEAEDVVNRMETLMLIKRRGVLLFHDIHPKAQRAVPTIIADFGSGVEWGDCRQIAKV